ncbi:LanC-like protein 3 like [Pseudolycoriella hygida]|uniref:LanC-like protein 3 like n=1 Tax=Pseudolycoriella hygida TaxID=35572 RepID=A0A9Q0S9N7_9DIPT|nr:LanC-like protein 3 like [Pseudolycoriella hygida]
MTSLDYFENPYEDWKDGGFSVDESYIRSLIYEYVRKIVDETFPMNSRQKYRNPNLFVGNAGIAFMFLKIYTSRCNFSDLKPEYYATEYIEDAKRNISPNHRHIYKAPQCSLLTGTAGIFCVSAAISSVLHKDLTMWSDLTNFYLGYEKCQKIDFIPHGRDEMLGESFS